MSAALDRWVAVPGCPCRECAAAAEAATPRTTLRLSEGAEVVLVMRPENAQDAATLLEQLPRPRFAPAAPKPASASASTSTSASTTKALETLKRMGWIR